MEEKNNCFYIFCLDVKFYGVVNYFKNYIEYL